MCTSCAHARARTRTPCNKHAHTHKHLAFPSYHCCPVPHWPSTFPVLLHCHSPYNLLMAMAMVMAIALMMMMMMLMVTIIEFCKFTKTDADAANAVDTADNSSLWH